MRTRMYVFACALSVSINIRTHTHTHSCLSPAEPTRVKQHIYVFNGPFGGMDSQAHYLPDVTDAHGTYPHYQVSEWMCVSVRMCVWHVRKYMRVRIYIYIHVSASVFVKTFQSNAHYLLLTTHYPLPTTHYPLPTTHCPLHTTTTSLTGCRGQQHFRLL
jgi:hypothetical protein